MRVSTDDQKLDLQRDALLKAGVEPQGIYEDKLSGARADRPSLAAALKAVRRGDTIVIWRLNRLGRSLKELVQLAADLKRHGIQLLSLTEQVDSSTPGGELIFHMFGALAQFERHTVARQDRQLAALAQGQGYGRLEGAAQG